jgi:hypothetical protein
MPATRPNQPTPDCGASSAKREKTTGRERCSKTIRIPIFCSGDFFVDGLAVMNKSL